MKVLIVCSGNAPNFNFELSQAFIYEQIEAIKKQYDICYDTFIITGKGIKGYLSNYKSFKKIINKNNYDLIHAHNMPSGLFSRLQLKLPLVVTYHGSDINIKRYRILSNILSILTSHNILVSHKQRRKLLFSCKISVIPCGINLDTFFPIDSNIAKKTLKFVNNKVYILFCSSFDIKVKNYQLAKDAIKILSEYEIEIIELKNKSREEVNLLLNACNLLLLTSLSEGSPQIIKEAMACNCPIVATDVGDINEVIENTEGCYITSFDSREVAQKIHKAIQYSKTKEKTMGRENVKHFDNKNISNNINNIYQRIGNQ
tara:strand:+ start:166 stop:1110 length:945 start_codon:yes stop_codon:yes gene_type:complete